MALNQLKLLKEVIFMIVTATEFKTNFGKYLDLLSKEDIYITRNGKTVAKVINPQISAVDALSGILKDVDDDIDKEYLRGERLSRYEDNV
jgi:antitoxin (DNA-binding transcriptional repressor) of toxin-antitoxin stability system